MTSSPIFLQGLQDGLFMGTLKYLRIRVMKLPYGRAQLIKLGMESIMRIIVYSRLTRRYLRIESIKAIFWIK